MKQNDSRRSRDTDCNQSHGPKSQTRPSVHQLGLQNSHCFTNDGVILGVIAFLPLHPIWRWLVVPLYHVHLMDPLPQSYHALVHQPSTEVLICWPSHGSLDWRQRTSFPAARTWLWGWKWMEEDLWGVEQRSGLHIFVCSLENSLVCCWFGDGNGRGMMLYL